jgi:hypothetical protein
MKLRDIWSPLIIAIIFGVFLAYEYINPYGGLIVLSDLLLQLSGSRGDFAFNPSWLQMTTFALRLLPYNVFQILVGITIYRHFCTASVYVFTRFTQKVRWYFRQILAVVATSILYLLVLVATAIALTLIRYDVAFDMIGMSLMLYHVAIHSLWLFSMTLLVNLLSILWGSEFAFGSVIGLQGILLVCLHFAYNALKNASGSWIHQFMLTVNPMTHLIMGWHTIFDLIYSLIYMIAIALFITLAGAYLIHKKDLLLNDIEEGN